MARETEKLFLHKIIFLPSESAIASQKHKEANFGTRYK